MKTKFIYFLFLACAALSLAADTPSSKFVGLASGNRKLADVGTDSELWVVTVVRAPQLRDGGFPEKVSVIYLTHRAAPHQWHASFPDGTEFVMQLTRDTSGEYQTIYYRDETHPPKLY
jgi:hypothetical protein